jgi:hypothetical protein
MDCLLVGRALRSFSTSFMPIGDSKLEQTGFREMVRKYLRLFLTSGGDPFLQHPRHRGMELLSATLQQGTVGHLLNQRMLEAVARLWQPAALKDQLGCNQLIERRSQVGIRQRRKSLEQPIGELATDYRADLSDLPHGAETIETRHKRLSNRRRDRQWPEWPCELVAVARSDEQSGLEHRLGQLLDEQRHAVSTCDDLLENLGRKGLRVADPVDNGQDLPPAQAGKR